MPGPTPGRPRHGLLRGCRRLRPLAVLLLHYGLPAAGGLAQLATMALVPPNPGERVDPNWPRTLDEGHLP
eukprot:11173154-Lingulodinium_polyedra.AAC.1